MNARPTLASLPNTDLADVALQLRRLADWIEKTPRPLSCVIVMGTAEATTVCGYGQRVSPLEIQGWLARAALQINEQSTRQNGAA
jgi:hypothetical protein